MASMVIFPGDGILKNTGLFIGNYGPCAASDRCSFHATLTFGCPILRTRFRPRGRATNGPADDAPHSQRDGSRRLSQTSILGIIRTIRKPAAQAIIAGLTQVHILELVTHYLGNRSSVGVLPLYLFIVAVKWL